MGKQCSPLTLEKRFHKETASYFESKTEPLFQKPFRLLFQLRVFNDKLDQNVFESAILNQYVRHTPARPLNC